MRAIVLLTIVAVATGAPKFSKKALSTPLSRGGGRIVGGTEAYAGEFPHQIALLRGGVGGSLMCEDLLSLRTWLSQPATAVMDKAPAGSESVLETTTSTRMTPTRLTLLSPRLCSTNSMTPGPSATTSVSWNLTAQLTLAAPLLERLDSHMMEKNTLPELPALFLDGEPPPG